MPPCEITSVVHVTMPSEAGRLVHARLGFHSKNRIHQKFTFARARTGSFRDPRVTVTLMSLIMLRIRDDCVCIRDENVRIRDDCVCTCDEYVRTRDDCVRTRDDCVRTRDDCVRTRDDCVRTRDDCVRTCVYTDGLLSDMH
jgi:hypothetical protein